MASPILVAVFAVILGSCSLTQAYSHPDHSTGTRLEEVKLDQISNQNKWNIKISTACATWLGVGAFVVVPIYGVIGKIWFDSEKEKNVKMVECEKMKDSVERDRCIKLCEEDAREIKSGCFSLAGWTTLMAAMTGLKIHHKCLSK